MKKVLWIAAALLSVGILVAGAAFVRWTMRDGAAAAEFREALDAYASAGGMLGPEHIVVPAPPEDAASLFALAFDAMRAADPEGKEPEPDVWATEDWDVLSPAGRRERRALLERYAAGLEKLRAAAARPGCRFPIRYEEGWAALLPHIAFLRAGAFLLSFEADSLAAQGRLDEAWARIDDILGLGMALCDDGLLVSQLVRIIVLETALDRADALLRRGPPAPALVERWKARFDVPRQRASLLRGYRGDFAAVVGALRAFFDGRPTGTDLDRDMTGWTKLLSRPKVRSGAARAVGRLTRALAVLDAPFQERDAALSALDVELRKDLFGFGWLIPALAKPCRLQLALEVHALRTFAAIEILRKPEFPETFDMPRDPVFQEPLIYGGGEGGFVLELHEKLATLLEGSDDGMPWVFEQAESPAEAARIRALVERLADLEAAEAAAKELSGLGQKAWPYLIERLDDPRPSVALVAETTATVGRACFHLIAGEINPRVPKAFRHDYLEDADDLRVWWAERGGESIEELRREAAQFAWVLAELNGENVEPFKAAAGEAPDEEWRESAKRLSELPATPEELVHLLGDPVAGMAFRDRRLAKHRAARAWGRLHSLELAAFPALAGGLNDPELALECLSVMKAVVHPYGVEPHDDVLIFRTPEEAVDWWTSRQGRTLKELRLEAARHARAGLERKALPPEEKARYLEFIDEQIRTIEKP